MDESNYKRFRLIVAAVAAIWIASLLILAPAASGIDEDRQEIQRLTDAIAALHRENIAPDGDLLEKAHRHNEMLCQQVQEIADKIHSSVREEIPENSAAFFNSRCKQKLARMERRAGQLKVQLQTRVFPESTSDKTLHDGYWDALEVGTDLVSILLELAGKTESLRRISEISYPRLQQPWSTQRTMVRDFPVKMTLESEFSYIMKLFGRCSQAPIEVQIYLFSMDIREQTPDGDMVPEILQKKFENSGSPLSDRAVVKTRIPGESWSIEDSVKKRAYAILKQEDELNVYELSSLGFLQIEEVELKLPDKTGSTIKATITLSAFQIDPKGEIERTSAEPDSPTTDIRWGTDWQPQNWDKH